MTDLKSDMANSNRIIQSYEEYAKEYSEIVGTEVSQRTAETLQRMVSFTGLGAHMLEVGSGPGIEADYLESLGAVVRRTDATRAFLAMQVERGKNVDLLNIISDKLGGPYDGVLALCVLIHVDRDHTANVLKKIRNALRPGGVFLVSLREGQGETGGGFNTIFWEYDEFIAHLAAADLHVRWHDRNTDHEGEVWLTFLAERQL
ncbi:class I SAM-dependent methyltransferase [Phyllobacterium sp. YR531]|uniref:class I SAM-dependent DNA methyltransferase n=1 Tax=Phyllobacterium sp. YR531 TaxID=1144343 RepID=UPI00026F4912|nr:class I SAM-dependent methyltransferase [Phyllobacterium sp. YR531]EJN05555.1 hypothetical protein PMI41_00761 [Phyllobacterium sp. YR531]